MSDELYDVRLEKVAKLRELGIDPYGKRFAGATPIAEARPNVPNELAEGEVGPAVTLAGRIMGKRGHGKLMFLDLEDRTGKLQIHLSKKAIGEAAWEIIELLDLADIIGVQGTLGRTRRGEPSCFATNVTMLSKALRPPPEKWHGLSDTEIRYRQRYVDLIANPEARRIAFARAKIITTLRQVLDAEQFLEVETPALQPIYGGASARPFKTHHNALNCTLYLRIADELYLKRLLVGGLERVYEISKDFRNEGLSRFHNPEFTMLEAYQAYGDYTDMMRLTEKLVAAAAAAVNGGTTVDFAGVQTDVAPPWPRQSYCGLIQEHTGQDVRGADAAKLADIAKGLKLPLEKHMDEGALLDLIFSEKVEPHLVGPIFVTEFPVSTTPLAKRSPDDPAYVDRFEAFIFGKELVNAFTELNDPVDQHQRFEEQMGLKAGGDEEAQIMDEDYVRALEHGMPPAGGLGLGVDRLTMFLTGAENIREVILFPKLKPLPAGADTVELDGDSDQEPAPEPSPAAEA